jgi:recombination protein RecR
VKLLSCLESEKNSFAIGVTLTKATEGTSWVLTQALLDMRTEIKYCVSCHNISDTDTCEICANKTEIIN